MKKHVSLAACLVFGLAAAAGTGAIAAQEPAGAPPPTYIPDIKFAQGREVVPYLEGWIRMPDGSFDFVFGYYNRNTEQELVIPPGPNNLVSPGPVDQGQPTYFMARRQYRIFRVRVPKDFGDKSLTWSITANGRTEKVVAKLVPAYEKEERFITMNNQTTILFGVDDPNKPPSITVQPVTGAAVEAPVTLTALYADDGLPKPRVINNDDPDRPTDQSVEEKPDPLARFKSQRNSSGTRVIGPRVTWQVYRGTGRVRLERLLSQVADGRSSITARFSAPGQYTLIATAGDGKLNTAQRFTVDVK
ncbi:MAG TPA: hypothetical protein VM032_05370 [Vicinamibacterales bacterium]|nr:hypothetical protein [Vicinamibacterales bacterium]